MQDERCKGVLYTRSGSTRVIPLDGKPEYITVPIDEMTTTMRKFRLSSIDRDILSYRECSEEPAGKQDAEKSPDSSIRRNKTAIADLISENRVFGAKDDEILRLLSYLESVDIIGSLG